MDTTIHFQSRSYQLVQFDSPEELSKSLNYNTPDYQAPYVLNEKGHKIAFCPYGHIDNSWQEVAVINVDLEIQLESITWAWVNPSRYLEYVLESISLTKPIAENLELQNDSKQSWFTCGSCGSAFMSTLKKQKEFDQDSGYGYCLKCEPKNHHIKIAILNTFKTDSTNSMVFFELNSEQSKPIHVVGDYYIYQHHPQAYLYTYKNIAIGERVKADKSILEVLSSDSSLASLPESRVYSIMRMKNFKKKGISLLANYKS